MGHRNLSRKISAEFCNYWAYADLIQKADIKISMCSSAEPNKNSMAERLKRIF